MVDSREHPIVIVIDGTHNHGLETARLMAALEKHSDRIVIADNINREKVDVCLGLMPIPIMLPEFELNDKVEVASHNYQSLLASIRQKKNRHRF